MSDRNILWTPTSFSCHPKLPWLSRPLANNKDTYFSPHSLYIQCIQLSRDPDPEPCRLVVEPRNSRRTVECQDGHHLLSLDFAGGRSTDTFFGLVWCKENLFSDFIDRPSFCSSHHTFFPSLLYTPPLHIFIMSSDEVYDGAIGIDLGMFPKQPMQTS